MSGRKSLWFLTLLLGGHVQCESNGNTGKKYTSSTLDSISDLAPFVNYSQSSWEQCSYFCARDESCHGFTLSNEAEQNTVECNLWSLPELISLQTNLSGEFFLDSTKYVPDPVLLLRMAFKKSGSQYHDRVSYAFSPDTYSTSVGYRESIQLRLQHHYTVPNEYSYEAMDEDFTVLCRADWELYCDVWSGSEVPGTRYDYLSISNDESTFGFLLHQGLLWIIWKPDNILVLDLTSGTWSESPEEFPCSSTRAKAFPISDTEVLVPGGEKSSGSGLETKTWILAYPTGKVLHTSFKPCPINPQKTMTCDMMSTTQLICSGTSRTDGVLNAEEVILAIFNLNTKEWEYVQNGLLNRNRALFAYDNKVLLLDIIEPEVLNEDSYYFTKEHLVYYHESGQLQKLPQLVSVTNENKSLRNCNEKCPYHVMYMDKNMKRN